MSRQLYSQATNLRPQYVIHNLHMLLFPKIGLVYIVIIGVTPHFKLTDLGLCSSSYYRYENVSLSLTEKDTKLFYRRKGVLHESTIKQ